MKNRFRKCLNVILISTLSISCWEICKKQIQYIENQIEHKKIIAEKESIKDMQEYLFDREYDWISVKNTAINYPLVQGVDNQYYLTHDHNGDANIAGAIFFDAIDKPYNGNMTVIYGHSMRDGTMFNNLHFFTRDTGRFRDSELIISDKDKDTKYVPLGFAIYDGKNPFHRKLDNSDINTTVEIMKENCKYFIDTNYKEDKHIIALITCEYSIDDGRLVVFYISE